MSEVRVLPDPPDPDALREDYAPDRGRPAVRMNFVTSLDGAVHVDGRSAGLSSEVDRQVFGILRGHADAVMVGAGTLRHEGYGPLRLAEPVQAWRRSIGLAAQPTLVVVSSSLKIDPSAPVFTEAPLRPIVLTHTDAPDELRAALRPVADVIVVDAAAGDADMSSGLAELNRRGLAQILCEGGPHLFGSLLAADLVDELCLTIAPLLAGPGPGRIVAGPPVRVPANMRLVRVTVAGDELLTRYERAAA